MWVVQFQRTGELKRGQRRDGMSHAGLRDGNSG